MSDIDAAGERAGDRAKTAIPHESDGLHDINFVREFNAQLDTRIATDTATRFDPDLVSGKRASRSPRGLVLWPLAVRETRDTATNR